MPTTRISASSYSNTAPLIWSFLYGANHGRVELILDNAPSRSAELLTQDRVDVALVPVIASQFIDDVKLIPNVCVGAKQKVCSVCLVTNGDDLENVKTVSLDTSSRTSVILTKIIFREFLGFEPEWRDSAPNIDAMLAESDAALLIGDPALSIADCGLRIADFTESRDQIFASESEDLETKKEKFISRESAIRDPQSAIRKFDLAELWNHHTGLGFVFAMWMTCRESIGIDFAAARDEGLSHLDEIAANYAPELHLTKDEMLRYLSENISYSLDGSMGQGMELFFQLAATHKLIDENKPVTYLNSY